MEKILKNMKKMDAYIHYMITLCGGFFGVYAIVSRMGNFGQAQTVNLIEMVGNILGKDLTGAIIRLLAVLIFISGIVLATILEKKGKLDQRYLAIFFDFMAAIIVGFSPLSMDPVIALYPFFFATAFQWCVFKGAKGYASATVFCTNNLKQTTISIMECLFMTKNNPERREKLEKAKFYGSTFLSFYIGVVVGYFSWYFYGAHSIWFIAIPLLVNFILVFVEKNKYEANFNIQKNMVHESTLEK
ncbi:DUF1275 domain-containing protein [Tetragenococcus koreensis]|uniref:Membrane protein n=1 Tax=Tetragenococcus koreensis TaxID=290335 RepID=A0AAN4RKF6_9ENTE|nr:YoaK family protein [Tetragenococcus koreensis]AYW45576.1 DUF1275 domain-containing protein [Tetragenococcus koreensis]MCF1617767.1 DUF1275 domain-containing protein [Tetragenococcus koreensis]MCF1619581.1 DUF1275 domain-containing protein [Tetragenococcus koreensis]MCF1622609.1 DUF1275 domain-containing protein [Tetragenococcus koreensis]MCF1678666.1 DUF1275 domain-containing protein [Tetragenococcus koreensis]